MNMKRRMGFIFHPNFGSPLKPKPLIEKIGLRPTVLEMAKKARAPRPSENVKLRPGLEAQEVKQLQKQRQRVSEAQPSTKASKSTTQEDKTTSSVRGSTTPKKDQITATYATAQTMPQQTTSSKMDKSIRQGFTVPSTSLDDKAGIFQKDYTHNGVFYNNGTGEPVHFDDHYDSIVHIKNTQYAGLYQTETAPKLLINLSCFNVVLTADSVTGTRNPTFYNVFSVIFARYGRQLLRKAKTSMYSNWSQANFGKVMGEICTLLEYYYTLDSILSYSPKGGLGMSRSLELYQVGFFNSSLLVVFNNLKNTLKGLWFPPKFSELIRWFYQNFKSSEVSQAAVYRYCPTPSYIPVSGGINTSGIITEVNNAINQYLIDSAGQDIVAMLCDAFPEGIILGTPPSTNELFYDKHHLEIFVNEPVQFLDAFNTNTVSIFPISYGSLKNDIAYYMDEDPSSTTNGLPYGLQYVNTSTNTSGVVLQDVRTKTSMREIISATVSSLTSNRWFIDLSTPSSIAATPRALNIFTQASEDANQVIQLQSSNAYVARPPVGFQRVFYDNQSGPTQPITDLVTDLFGLH